MPRRKKKPVSVFVIMPFKNVGSDQHKHYLSIYSDYLKPSIEQVGGEPLRADEIAEPGSINSDLIDHIVNADIVIADLTDLSANVMYELGIRHSMKSRGTILILDELKTESIPFDLSSYRVIKYKSDAQGLAHLKNEMIKYLKNISFNTSKKSSDNPVHDWLEKAGFGRKYYKDSEGQRGNKNKDPVDNDINVEIKSIIEEAMTDAAANLIPKSIIEKAENAVKNDDLSDFLECVNEFIGLNVFLPSDREFREMYYLAKRIDARSKVTKSILELGISLFPESVILLNPFISHQAHSTSKQDRERAKEIVQKHLRISRDNDETHIEDINVLARNTHLLSLMLDAYHKDGQHKEAYEITSSLKEQFPDNTVALRNHARAMNRMGGFSVEHILKEYRQAVIVDQPSYASALWYGSELAYSDRLIDSLEAHLFACILDLDDSECFARLADTMSDIVQPRNLKKLAKMDRSIPDEVNREAVIKCIMLAIDCPGYGAEQKFLCEIAMRNIGFGVEELEFRLSEEGELTRTDRRHFVEPLYDLLKSEITYQTK